MSSGASWRTWTRSKCSSAAARRVRAVEALDDRARERALASRGPTSRPADARSRGPRTTGPSPSSGQRERAPVHLLRRLGDADVVAERLRHLLDAVRPRQDRDGEDRLLGHAVGALHVAREEQVERLVGAAELDVGADRDRVVALHERIEQLEHRDRRARGEALGEVVALEHLGDRGGARERKSSSMRHVEPLGVEAQLVERRGRRGGRWNACSWYVRALRSISSPDSTGRVRRAAARVADPRGEVADDQDDLVAEVLELAELLQDDRVAEVDVGARSGRGRASRGAGGPRARPPRACARGPPAGARRRRFG